MFGWMLKKNQNKPLSTLGIIFILAKIVRALFRNKIVFAFLQKVNHSIATKLCVKLMNTCAIFLKNGALHNSMTKLCSAFFKYENKLKIGWVK